LPSLAAALLPFNPQGSSAADNKIAIKVSLEVSSIANQITTITGTLAYQIGTRTASTVHRRRFSHVSRL